MRFTTLLATGCAAAAFMSVPAAAQDAPAAEAAEQDIIVTARQREESLKDVPIAVTALSGDMLKQQQVNTVKDIAALAPGLNINSDSVGRAFVSMRGIGTTLIDTVQPGVVIFIDGIYQPNTSYLNSPIVDVARIEVLRGPQGTLFGNNTLGGAINVITRQPGNRWEGRMDGALAGSDDYRSVSASISGPIVEDVLQVRIGGAYHHQDGFQDNILAGGKQNPLTQKTVNGTVRLKPAQWAQFTLNASYDRVSGGNTPYLNVAGPTDYTLDGSTNQLNRATITYKGVNLKGEFDADAINTRITVVGAYNRRDVVSAGDGDHSPIDFLRTAGRSKLITKTGELRFDTQWSDSISTLIGVFASKSTTDASAVNTIVPLGISAPSAAFSENKSQAVFGTIFAKLTDTLDLAVGGRYDHQTLDVSTATTAPTYRANEFQPRVTLSNRWSPDFMTYASVSRGVRGGGQNGPGAPNLIYRGDDVWTYELGTKLSSADRRFSLDAAIFYNDYKNFIGQNSLAPNTSGVGFVAINLNTGTVESYGVEAEASYRVTDNWRLSASATLLHARITDDSQYFATTGFHVSSDRIIFTPDWNFNIGTNYTVPLGSNALIFDANIVAKGSRMGSSLDPNVAPRLSSYRLVNGSVTFRLGDHFDIAGFATNLFNAKYIESYIDRSVLLRAGLPAPIARNLAIQGNRRRIGVRATARF